MNNTRRQQIRAIRDQIEELMQQEQAAKENLPEGLQYSDRALQMAECADCLCEIYDLLENMIYSD